MSAKIYPNIESNVTLYAKATDYNSTFAAAQIVGVYAGSTATRYELTNGANSANQARSLVVVSSTTYADQTVPSTHDTSVHKYVMTATTNEAFSAYDGTISTVDTSVTLPSGLETTDIGHRIGSLIFNGEIKELMILPAHLTQAQSQTLTTA